MTDELDVRLGDDTDLPAIIELLQRSMGRTDDARFVELFRWKHLESPFGRSPMWLAVAGDRIVGLRTFMRWDFVRDEQRVRCVRAVDTATDPDFQGRGIFRRLTLDALPHLGADGVQFVFNTPNSQSRPGYLKMGWREIGRAAACVRPLSIAGGIRLARNRVPAAHWSESTDVGQPVREVLDSAEFHRLVAQRAADHRLRTRADLAFFSWRYDTPILGYRAVPGRNGIADGVAFVRLRRRGASVELVLAMMLVPDGARSSARDLLRVVVSEVKGQADYVLGVGGVPGCVPVPKFGPVVTAREVAAPAPATLAELDLQMGDVELF